MALGKSEATLDVMNAGKEVTMFLIDNTPFPWGKGGPGYMNIEVEFEFE